MSKLEEQLFEIGKNTEDLSKDLTSSILEKVNMKKNSYNLRFIKIFPLLASSLVPIIIAIVVITNFSKNDSNMQDMINTIEYNICNISEIYKSDDKDIYYANIEIDSKNKEVYIIDEKNLLNEITSDNAIVYYENGINGKRFVIDSTTNEKVVIEIEIDAQLLDEVLDAQDEIPIYLKDSNDSYNNNKDKK